MTTWRAFWAAVACLSGAIFIGPQPNIVFHAIGVVLFVMACYYELKFASKWKRDLTGRRGSQAVLAQRRAQPPTIQKTSPGSNTLTFKRDSE